MSQENPPATPSRALRTYARLSQWLFGIALGGWLALGLTAGLLHGFIVPRIDQLRPWLEARASQALGAQLRIGRISATSSGLLPSFELTDIALLDVAGDTPLTVERVRVSVSALSLWRLGVKQIVIEQPQARITRLADGRFALGGMRFGAGAPANAGDDDAALDWLLAQPELLIERGAVRISGPATAAASDAESTALQLDDLRLVVRNQGRRHAARLDAQITTSNDANGNGQPLTLIAQLRAPLLSTQASRRRHWTGQVYADVPPIDLAALASLAGSSPTIERGRASLRIWADLQDAELLRASADVKLSDLALRLPDAPVPFAMQQLEGQLDWNRLDGGSLWHGQQLVLVNGDGERWPGRELKFSQQRVAPNQETAGTFSADRIDLTQLAKLARGLPLPADARATLARVAPKGTIDALNVGWHGPADAFPPPRFQASGQARGIEFAAQMAAARNGVRTNPGVPGLRGADATFDLNQNGGQATLHMASGTVTFPGIFEEPTVPFTELNATVNWQQREGRWEVTTPDLKFANADAAGNTRLRWREDAPMPPKAGAALTAAAANSPGSIDLDGTLERGNLTRLHRYLPLELPVGVRRYLREALTAGSASAVRFQVKGALRDFPYVDPKRGQFRLAAQLRDTTFVFAPPSVQPANELPWPPLVQMNGELVLERASLQVNKARGRFGNAPGLPISGASASIADFDRPVVLVDASTRAPLSDLLRSVRSSPVDALLDHALRNASGTGTAQLKTNLSLPIDQLERSKVQGSLTLAGNDLQLDSDSLQLQRANGDLTFTERGFQVAGVEAQLFGGPVRIEGGSSAPADKSGGPATPLVELRARGTANAKGLRGAADAGPLAQLARVLDGTAEYDANLRVLRGGTELTVTSDLRGVAIDLPAPLGKPADAALALRYENAPVSGRTEGDHAMQDRLTVNLGNVASLRYERVLAAAGARVVRGSIALGTGTAPALPTRGVAARVDLPQFDLDRWTEALAVLQEASEPMAGRKPALPMAAPDTTAAAVSASARVRSYWPTQWQARVGEFASDGIDLHKLSLEGTREGLVWRNTAQADELAGRIEFRESADGGPGRLRARLERLRLGEPANAAATTAERKDEKPTTAAEQLPALDVVVDRFELRGHDLGRLEIDAVNRPSEAGGLYEWRLNKLGLTMPEAAFTAQGKWTRQPPPGDASAKVRAKTQTALDFELDIVDSGRLLERFGVKDVVRQGRGAMAGRLGWTGSPLTLDYPTMHGRFHLDIAAGQFLKADPGLAKLLGVLSLQALPRRLSLDFRDLFSTGFAFDFVRGDVGVQRGVASSNNLQMKGASAAVLMDGRADIEAETQSLHVVVVPEIDAGTAALVATAINPALGLGTFLAQYFLRKPLSRAATQEFQIDGTWGDPRITKVKTPSTFDAAAEQGAPVAADTAR